MTPQGITTSSSKGIVGRTAEAARAEGGMRRGSGVGSPPRAGFESGNYETAWDFST